MKIAQSARRQEFKAGDTLVAELGRILEVRGRKWMRTRPNMSRGEPASIFDKRTKSLRSRNIVEYLVRWQGDDSPADS